MNRKGPRRGQSRQVGDRPEHEGDNQNRSSGRGGRLRTRPHPRLRNGTIAPPSGAGLVSAPSVPAPRHSRVSPDPLTLTLPDSRKLGQRWPRTKDHQSLSAFVRGSGLSSGSPAITPGDAARAVRSDDAHSTGECKGGRSAHRPCLYELRLQFIRLLWNGEAETEPTFSTVGNRPLTALGYRRLIFSSVCQSGAGIPPPSVPTCHRETYKERAI